MAGLILATVLGCVSDGSSSGVTVEDASAGASAVATDSGAAAGADAQAREGGTGSIGGPSADAAMPVAVSPDSGAMDSGQGGALGSVDGGADAGHVVGGGDAASPASDAGDGEGDAGANSTSANRRPCDIYASGGTPCIAAHSTVRALYGSYQDKLYQVRRSSDNSTKDIGALAAGGAANAAEQDSFCAGSSCVITLLYDQSGHGNHLEYQGAGSSVGGRDKPASATSESLNIDGQKVYSLYINPGNSYWRDGHATGVPTGAAPEGMYMVTSGMHVNGGCCFDYGNSETTRSADGAGAMDAIYFGTSCWFGGCSGQGPWVQADLEYGLFPGGSKSWNQKQMPFSSRYVTALLKNDGRTKFALKGADAQRGGLTTLWDGALPQGYSPMKKQGAIVLGSGGDCCARNTNQSLGTFYEGAMVAGYPSDDTETQLQANIVEAGYGK